MKPVTGTELLANYDTFLFDADGVLWLADTVIDGAVTALHKLIQAGKTVLVITNNSTKTPKQYAEKIKKLGFDQLSADNIVSAAMVACSVLSKDPRSKELPVYLIGSPNLATMLEEAGVKSFGTGPDNLASDSNNFVSHIDVSRKVFAVVTSYDPHFNYVKLTKAVNYLKHPEVDFIVTNEDRTFPTNVPGLVVPGAGTTSLSVRAISGRDATVMGKPEKSMFDFINEKFKIDPKRTLMVGDRLDTDIQFGNSNGIQTLLVLTGVHQLDYVEKVKDKNPDLVPSFYADSIRVFLE